MGNNDKCISTIKAKLTNIEKQLQDEKTNSARIYDLRVAYVVLHDLLLEVSE